MKVVFHFNYKNIFLKKITFMKRLNKYNKINKKYFFAQNFFLIK